MTEASLTLAPARAYRRGVESGSNRTRAHDAEPHATSPAMRLLDRYLANAVDAGASDLHFEPAFGGILVRARIDGVLRVLEPPPQSLADSLLTRTRLLAGADLSEKRLPQDGRFRFRHHGDSIDVRAAFMPVHGGERIALRFIAADRASLGIDHLGLDEPERALLARTLDRPNGMIVVVGPTGSGKTTTLYAAIERLRRPQLSIVTVEDPVERDLDGVSQVAVDEPSGRTFAAVLRAVLRQDPDALMVGEIRDPESARIACRAALTGHRVLTTLHTSDTREALLRITDMGVPDYLASATVSLVIAQRLLRRLCTDCRRETSPRPSEVALCRALGMAAPETLARPAGCGACGNEGYRGRLGVFETLVCRTGGNDDSRPRRYLLQEGLRRAAALDTSFEEAVAVCPEPSR